MKKRVLFSLLVATIFILLLAACGGSSTKPPFSNLSFDATEKDVVSKYGECDDLSVDDTGAKSYHYPCVYHSKPGVIFFYFSPEGKLENIFWHYTSQTEEEQSALLNSLVNEYTKKYGEPDLVHDLGTVWNMENMAVTIVHLNTTNLQIVFTVGGTNDGTVSENGDASNLMATSIYHKGDVVEGAGFKLTIDSVDATPVFGDYLEADEGEEYFFVSFELENISSEPLDSTSFFKILADGEECRTISFSDKYNGVDWFDTITDLEAGRKTKSYISATVPEGWKEVQLVCADGSAFSFTRADLGDISSTGTSTKETVYRVGESIPWNGMTITLTKVVQTDYVPYLSTMYYEPSAGNHYIIMEFDVKNTAAQPQRFNSLATFDVYIDDYSGSFTGFFADYDGMQALNDQSYTDISSGKSISGYQVVQAPDGWGKIELTSRQGTFEITPDVVTIQ